MSIVPEVNFDESWYDWSKYLAAVADKCILLHPAFRCRAAWSGEFNRWTQRMFKIFLPLFHSLMFFVDVHTRVPYDMGLLTELLIPRLVASVQAFGVTSIVPLVKPLSATPRVTLT